MTAYLIGYFIGRLFIAWFLVFLGTLVWMRGRWRRALLRSVWPWGWIAVVMLFGLGLLGSAIASYKGG
ncbi:protein of unknown function [Methylacidimicrobium sp. AP8]|uniref:hypothetical protein n=1 Tax=Methylacidimicrobium sp. AP8 TaxID=2730359 RepID=UPI0018C16939|nr:hypothetical protein [Methylacidimicrobium sp. AP8]CAB4243620.1 protein of unknown function [Methylacidimicrobium sp. AP8]